MAQSAWYAVGIKEVRAVEIAVLERYGQRLSDLALTSSGFRMGRFMAAEGIHDGLELAQRILAGERSVYDGLLASIFPPTTELFRDPSFWSELRDGVLPSLVGIFGQALRVWVAAFDSGEELYSLCVVLDDAGLLPFVEIYASYISEQVRYRAAQGLLPARRYGLDCENFGRYNSQGELARYFDDAGELLRLKPELLKHVQYVEQGVEFTPVPGGGVHLALCRNQLIFFNNALGERNVGVLAEALHGGGALAVGVCENLENYQNGSTFTPQNSREGIYRRLRN